MAHGALGDIKTSAHEFLVVVRHRVRSFLGAFLGATS
jgi:hypothetical protein